MSTVAKWGLIGPGNIGKELERQLGQTHVAERLGLDPAPSFIVRSSGITINGEENGVKSLGDIDDFPDVTFLAMPTSDDGLAAKDYITHALERGGMAVTAEKGSMASHHGELRELSDDFAKLGVNATVGGGTRVLDVAKEYTQDVGNISQIHLVLNGTLSAISSLIAPPEGAGMSLGQAVHQAVQLGYAEPGAQSPYDVIRGEAEGDIPKKTAIFFNKTELGDEIDWSDLRFSLTDQEIAQSVEEARVRRFIVSLYSPLHLDRAINCPEDDIVGGFDVEHNDWRIIGGFRRTDRNPLFSPLANLTGPGNGIVMGLGPDETDGVYSLSGPGAGVRPTVNTMIDDYVSRVVRSS